MGVSTDGILAYGYDLGESGEQHFVGFDEDDAPAWLKEDPDDEDTDLKDFGDAAERRLLDASGFTETWETRIGDGYHKRETEAQKALGVQIETHCSGDYPMYLLAAKVITASRGTAEAVDLTLPDNAAERLAWAVETLGLDVGDQKPRWLLASYWG